MHLANNKPDRAGRNRFPATTSWPMAGLLVVGLLVLAGAGPEEAAVPEATLARRRQEIEQLSQSQRQELIRKYDTYRQLSESERDRLRSLHKSIESDAELKQVMEQYCEWLKNLDVTQREQLRQAQTSEQKRNLVVKFKQEQHQRREELWREQGPPGPGPGKGPMAPLSADELKGVMVQWEAELTKSGAIPPARLTELENLQGTERYKLLMRSLADYRHPQGESPKPFQIPDTVLDTMLAAVKNPDVQKKLRQSRLDPAKRQVIERDASFMLLWSTMNEARRSFKGSESAALKERVFKTTNAEFQARYAQLPTWQQELALMHTYRNEIWQAFADACDFPKGPGNGGRGPGRGGPFGGFPGDRMRDGERMRDGDRSRGDRPPFRQQRRPEDRPEGRPGEPPPEGRRQPRDGNP